VKKWIEAEVPDAFAKKEKLAAKKLLLRRRLKNNLLYAHCRRAMRTYKCATQRKPNSNSCAGFKKNIFYIQKAR